MRKALMIGVFTCASTIVLAQVNIIKTICGGDTYGFSSDGYEAKYAILNCPSRMCLDRNGNMYIAEGFNHRIRRIDPKTGIITTVAGNGIIGFSGDNGPATNSQLFVPEGVTTNGTGNVYIADAGNNRIRKITISTGIITTVAGSGASGLGVTGSGGDGGPSTNAELCNPSVLHVDKNGNLFIADFGNNKVRRVDAIIGIITTVAGKGTTGYTGGVKVAYTGDGGPAINAEFSGIQQVYIDASDNIFICDQWNHAIRKVSASNGVISTIAGNGSSGYIGDGGPATKAKLFQPTRISVTDEGSIYVSEYGNGTVRKINGTTGTITTVVGTGVFGFSGDGGPANNANLNAVT